jgi:uncharacterized protein YjbI with pentapeptide repeats
MAGISNKKNFTIVIFTFSVFMLAWLCVRVSARESAFVRRFAEVTGEELKRAIFDDREIILNGCTVEGEVCFKHYLQTVSKINVRSTTFLDRVSFDHTECFGPMYFDSVTFRRPVEFLQVRFRATVSIFQSSFSDTMLLRGCVFEREAYFSSVVFPRGADFSCTSFDTATFEECQLYEAWFQKTYLGKIDFRGSRIDNAIFQPISLPSSLGLSGAKGLESLMH